VAGNRGFTFRRGIGRLSRPDEETDRSRAWSLLQNN
jgi:hypothetical protein